MLGILLCDELFNQDDEMIVDELLTFFFAGSQTSSVATQNLFLHLMRNPAHGQKVLKELEDTIVKPYLKEVKPQDATMWCPAQLL